METTSELSLLEAELSRIGLLLEHDAELPSATTLIAGTPIHGSWWGHALGQRIYALLEEFGEGEGALVVKAVNGKRTYVHRSLWSSFLTLVRKDEQKRIAELSPLARSLHERALAAGGVRLDSLVASDFAPPKELTKAGAELESAFLVHAAGLHTDSGAHTKLYRSFDEWAKDSGFEAENVTLTQAQERLRGALERLSAGVSRRPKLTLL
jgi:hypothetical protein